MSKRSERILEMLTEQGRIEVSRLSEVLGVSQVTIRKDLDELEGRGIIVREYGCAVLKSPDDISSRLAYYYEAKRKIAERAAELVSNGDTIMIESGSCCALLAETLAKDKKDLTIITNSAFIAGYIRGNPNVQVVLLGGIYQQDSQVMVGPLVSQCAESFFVKNFFIGVDGYSPQIGFTNQDYLRAQAVRDMARQADQVVVLTESEKFSRQGVVPIRLKDRKITVVTDDRIESKVKSNLVLQGIETLFISVLQ